MLDRLFKLGKRNANPKTEILSGITTFMAAAYILAVNPDILASANMDMQATLVSTALMAGFGCLCMGLLANFPMIVSASLGLNTFFAYTICRTMGFSWQFALLCVFVEGIVYTILTLTRVSEKIFMAIPGMLKTGISVGIGLFIAFVGIQKALIVSSDASTLLAMIRFTEVSSTTIISAILAFLGLLLVAFLEHKHVTGSYLIAILSVWGVGIVFELLGFYQADKSLIPSFTGYDLSQGFSVMFAFATPEAFDNFQPASFVLIVFCILLVHIFGTMGSVIACIQNDKFSDEKGNIPGLKKALLADSLTSCAGGVFGCSTPSVLVESISGISIGGRTGMSACVTGIMFLLSIFLSPLFIAIPSFATAPIMIYIGYLMLDSIKLIDFKDIPNALPAAVAIIFIPLTYSITDGIALGLIAYCILGVLSGKAKKISPLIYAMTIMFILKFILI